MEVGAVKQDFNNEIIHLKKSLSQARTQIIHKLTRKAKTLTEKKAPEKLQEKLKRKAELAIREVLVLKKIKARDIAKFSIIHKEELQVYLNKPKIDNDKACARLLLHKALQDKYKAIRNRFLNVPIRDLFMSRQERRKLKKEFKDKEKEKRKAKELRKKNKESEWKIEDIVKEDNNETDKTDNNIEVHDDDDINENEDIADVNTKKDELGSDSDESKTEDDIMDSGQSDNESIDQNDDKRSISEESDDKNSSDENIPKINLKSKIKPSVAREMKQIGKLETCHEEFVLPPKVTIKKTAMKPKTNTKNKNFKEKISQRTFKKDENAPSQENKIVDSFFITSSGGNYMSVAEPRQPDEVKEVHREGNRKLRRAVMFGHVPKNKPRQNHREYDKFNNNTKNQGYGNKIDKQNGFHKNKLDANSKNSWSNDNKNEQSNRNGFKDNTFLSHGNFKSKPDDSKPEKLHPSWEAKKRQSGILPFQGKKIVFDES